MSDLSRSEKILAEKSVCVLLVRGEDPDGAAIYAYIGIRADRLQEFMQAQKSGMFYPEEFGVVIESGTGEPDEATRRKMEQEYGFDHQAMLDVPDSTQANQILAKALSPKEDPSE